MSIYPLRQGTNDVNNRRSDPQENSASDTSDRYMLGGRINILVVDDEPRNLTVLETVLADPRYRIVRAE